MTFSDSEDALGEGLDAHSIDHSSCHDERVAKALAELRKIARQEAALRARIDDLTRSYKLPTGRWP